MAKYSQKHYDDVFEDIMKYANMELRKDGIAIKVRDREDLKKVFRLIDKNRRDQKGQSRFTEEFINKTVDSKKANSYVGERLGTSVGTAKTFKSDNTTTPKVLKRVHYLKSKGRDVYSYNKGYAVKVLRRREGQPTTVYFVDVMMRKSVDTKEINNE